MRTINEREFEAMCREVHRQASALTEGITDPSQRTQKLLRVLFDRVCQHLQLDCQAQMAELEDHDGFALLQTLEEHMQPEFFYSNILDQCLLTAV